MNPAPRTALVVDDDPDALFTYQVGLEASGYHVLCAASETEARELMDKVRPDVAVLDLMMEQPDSGFVLAWRIKKTWPQVPVVLVSAVSNRTRLDFDAHGAGERGWAQVDSVLTKPVRPEQLAGELERLLGA